MTETRAEQFAAITSRTRNIGDDIQLVAALQYLPPNPLFLDRDRIGDVRLSNHTKAILNGWWMHSPGKWPPPPEIDPLIVSFYAVPHEFENSWRLDYLREQSRKRPIGARDLATLSMFADAGVDAYLSGCLTLTLSADSGQRRDRVLAVDLDPECATRLAPRGLTAASHNLGPQRFVLSTRSRLRRAMRLLADYSAARLVVTTRLHAALPCLALGTPVLFVAPETTCGRLSSWLPHLFSCSRDDLLAGRIDYDLSNPPANPATWRHFADELVATCEAYTGRTRVPFTRLAI